MNKLVIDFMADIWVFYGGDSDDFEKNWEKIRDRLKEIRFK